MTDDHKMLTTGNLQAVIILTPDKEDFAMTMAAIASHKHGGWVEA